MIGINKKKEQGRLKRPVKIVNLKNKTFYEGY